MAVRMRGVMFCHSDDGGQGMWVKWLTMAAGRCCRIMAGAR
jgi:hypothetical protein